MKSVQDVVAKGLCISCGACAAATRGGAIAMRESVQAGMYWPANTGEVRNWGSGVEYEVCPGKGYEITGMAAGLFPEAMNSELELGRWQEAWACRSTSTELVQRATSGGVMTAISAHLLERGVVDGVVVTRFAYGHAGPRPETFLAQCKDELMEAQGSKYCPVPALEILSSVADFPGRILFVGTPCQIAGLRLLQRQNAELRRKFPITIGNFCGGFRDLRETDRIIRRARHTPGGVVEFRYRGGGQPGSMRIQASSGAPSELDYPEYVRFTGITKNRRCRLCVDATAELADFACGDAWIPRFLESGQSWSLVLARSSFARSILHEMKEIGILVLADVTPKEIKLSQVGNLTSKKVRQDARRKLYSLLGLTVPYFDGGYYREGGGMGSELKILVSHWFLSLLERLRLYPFLAKLIGRYPKDAGE